MVGEDSFVYVPTTRLAGNFQMRRETFLYLCEKVAPTVVHCNTRLRKAITVEQRVAITLWCLATPCEYWTIVQLFGVLGPPFVPSYMRLVEL